MRASRVLAAIALAGTFLLPGSAAGQDEGAGGQVLLLRLDGVVDPFVASYVESGIRDTRAEGAAAVLLTIDTPGGLDSSMRTIVQAVLNSPVPVVCYVAPEGARAASAGTFVLMACPVAAMAPATNVGAAHPVGLSGAVASEKATNDAAEFLVSLAERRGRNAEWAERAVRESESASAEEAFRLGVIDLIAPDVGGLLRELDGRTVEVGGGREATLALSGATVRERGMGWGTGLLHTLLDPNLAFIFFYLGLALIIAELFVPGLVLGTLGVVLLLLAVVALGMLPVQILGLVLIVASVVFFILELKVPGLGLASVGGLVTLVLGGLFLFDQDVPSAQVSPWVIAPVAGFAGLFFTVVVQAAIAMRRRPATIGPITVLGAVGTVLRDVDPTGVVHVAAEEWTGESRTGPIPAGSRVRVVSTQGLRLIVEPADVDDASGTPVGPGREGGTE